MDKQSTVAHDKLLVRILEDQVRDEGECVRCVHLVRGICALLCAAPKSKCRYYEQAKGSV